MASILCCTSGNQTVEAVVQPAWDNHFAAFGGQDVSKVLLDYCEESKIIVYNWHDDTETVYNGMAGDCVEIKQCVGCTRQVFTKSFPGDDAAVLARSSGEEPAPPRHRAGIAAMAWKAKILSPPLSAVTSSPPSVTAIPFERMWPSSRRNRARIGPLAF